MLQSPQPPPGCANVPGRHAHEPPMQYCEAMHIAQLVPQCSGSDVTSAQVAPHICEPAAVQVHWPLTHCSPVAHECPQRPQLAGSLDGSMHAPSHAI